jgi:hypothetical protein
MRTVIGSVIAVALLAGCATAGTARSSCLTAYEAEREPSNDSGWCRFVRWVRENTTTSYHTLPTPTMR